VKWIFWLVSGLVGALFFQQWVDFQDPLLRESGAPLLAHILFAGAVLLALTGAAGGLRWRRLSALARQYPMEPWRWDHPWRRELLDEQVSTVLSHTAGLMCLMPFIVVFNLGFFTGVWKPEWPLLSHLVAGVFFTLMHGAIIYEFLIPYVAKVLALVRYGRTRLRLPQIPLALGTDAQVELVLPRGAAQLDRLRAELRRVRIEKVRRHTKTDTRTTTEWQCGMDVDAKDARQGESISMTLVLPRAGPGNTTVLRGRRQCRWELHITSQVRGLDLDVSFLLPVYWLGELPPSPEHTA
jgi:hypothetical protein